MANSDILNIALSQSAIDAGCAPEDFLKQKNVVVKSVAHPDARRYLKLPFDCNLISYGTNIVASVSEDCREAVTEYISRFPVEHCFETPNIYVLDDMLLPYNLKVCFMAEYYLPDLDKLKEIPCKYETRVLHSRDFENLYLPQWSNALCEKRKELDVLGVGAYDGDKLIGLAGCSADCEDMYQIGIDVLPEYRRQGIACSLTTKLALEILKLDKVPFYCTAWCNLKSARNAIKCGFVPAWVELTARDIEFVNEFNCQLKI